jgi:formate dehydrogenase assembly factor FdhD
MDNPWTRLTVCLYRKRKCIEELTITSDDSNEQEDKVTTIKEKNKQTTPRIRKRIKCTECGVPQKNIWRYMKSDVVVSPKATLHTFAQQLVKLKGAG